MTLATVLPLTPRLMGAPDSKVTIPDSAHPPTVDLRRRLSLFFKKGIWYTKLTKATSVRSKTDGPKSYLHPTYGLVTLLRSPPLPLLSVASIARARVYPTCSCRSFVMLPCKSTCREL